MIVRFGLNKNPKALISFWLSPTKETIDFT
jgi:hypothetical protein